MLLMICFMLLHALLHITNVCINPSHKFLERERYSLWQWVQCQVPWYYWEIEKYEHIILNFPLSNSACDQITCNNICYMIHIIFLYQPTVRNSHCTYLPNIEDKRPARLKKIKVSNLIFFPSYNPCCFWLSIISTAKNVMLKTLGEWCVIMLLWHAVFICMPY